MVMADIDKLATSMGLSSYQKNVLKSNKDAYKLNQLIKHGCVLYAPRATHSISNFVRRILFGRPVDLIGKNKMLVRNQCGIQFFSHGFYSVPIGRFKYYADENGDIVARKNVLQKIHKD